MKCNALMIIVGHLVATVKNLKIEIATIGGLMSS